MNLQHAGSDLKAFVLFTYLTMLININHLLK